MNNFIKSLLLTASLNSFLIVDAHASIIDRLFKSNKEEKKEDQALSENKSVEPAADAKVEEKSEAKIEQAEENKNCFDASRGFSDVVEKVLPAVVNVATTQVVSEREDNAEVQGGFPGLQGSPFDELFKKFMDQSNKPRKVQSLGSGFIIKKDDKAFYVVTNYHVVQDAKKIKIFLHDKTELEGKIHASDERTDIAVIKINLDTLPSHKPEKIICLDWGNTESSRVGDWVIAIGNPFGFGSSVTVGVLSHKGRDTVSKGMGGRLSDYVDDYIQHSAQINFGNSGGCLLDTKGKVIGINTAIISPSGGNVGIGFAIPSDIAKTTVDQLIEFGRTKRGWLGVKVQAFTEEMAESIGKKDLANKPIVMHVSKDGPSEKAGIQREDIIIEFDGKPLDGQSRLSRLVGETPVGKSVPIKVWRKGGKEVILTVVVGEYEDAEQKGQIDEDKAGSSKSAEGNGKTQEILGLTIATLTNQLKERLRVQDKNIKGGVIVLKIDPTKALEFGLMRGDIIVEINQNEINSPKDFIDCIEKSKKDNHKNVLLLVMRNNGGPHYVTIKIVEDEDINEKSDKEEKSKSEQPKALDSEESKQSQESATEHPGNKPKALM